MSIPVNVQFQTKTLACSRNFKVSWQGGYNPGRSHKQCILWFILDVVYMINVIWPNIPTLYNEGNNSISYLCVIFLCTIDTKTNSPKKQLPSPTILIIWFWFTFDPDLIVWQLSLCLFCFCFLFLPSMLILRFTMISIIFNIQKSSTGITISFIKLLKLSVTTWLLNIQYRN